MASEIAEVADEDLTGALSTMNVAGPMLERLRSGTRDCGARLAWVTLSRPNDDTAKPVRISSGTYVSPSFVVAKTPIRVAIPYPAPYETGHGSLTVFGVNNNLTVALSPAWQVSSDTGTATQTVIWHPVKACVKP